MPDLLLELYCEEMPASMQANAAAALQKQVTDAVVDKGLTYEAARSYWTPRRLTLDLRGLTAKSQNVHETRKGPAVKAPKAALEGFMRAAGLASLDEAKILTDQKKGDYYSAEIIRKGRPAEEILAEILPPIIRNFSWPKSMRWGAASAEAGAPRWVRPLHSILCLLSTDTESQIVPFAAEGIKSGDYTFGHPFMYGREPIKIRRFEDYAAKLDKAYIVLDAERRKNIILADAHNLCFAKGLELVEDERLAEEVAGLVEWPVVLLGQFDADFLKIPAEIIRLTIRSNQKCFVTRPMPPAGAAACGESSADGENEAPALANYFVLTANIAAADGGAEIVKGNGKVVRARLADALYFWQADQKPLPDRAMLAPAAKKFGLDLAKPLDQRLARLDALNVTFHARLGTQGARVSRIAALAGKIAPLVAAPRAEARRAAILAKADLQTEIVGEFPELQGLMGHKYALLQGESAAVAAAIEEHYKPQGPKDKVPRNPVSVAVALADKIDSLTGFWLIDEKPTGSKDPYALRRAALGVIRLVLSQEWRIALMPLFREAAQLLQSSVTAQHMRHFTEADEAARAEEEKRFDEQLSARARPALAGLLGFIHERFKVHLREEGARFDVIEAVLAPDTDNLLQAARKAEALIGFMQSEDGAALLSGAKRALNILAAEEAKKTAIAKQVDPVEFVAAEETALFDAVFRAEKKLQPLLEEHNFSGALSALAQLRGPIDAFFDHVLVNDENAAIRANRLAILARIRRLTAAFADFSKLSG